MIEHQEHANGDGMQLAPAHPVAGPIPGPQPETQPTPGWLIPLQLTVEQFAILTNYSVRTVKRLVSAGAIPGITRVGRCVRLNRRAVEQWIEAGCPRPAGRTFRRNGK